MSGYPEVKLFGVMLMENLSVRVAARTVSTPRFGYAETGHIAEPERILALTAFPVST
jgi:hypothetical protein